jgi:hypothetical protein
MNQDERKATMDANLPEVTSIHSTSFYFNWSWKGCGFGQMSMSIVDGKLEAMDEYMSRESVRKLLIAYANHVADNCSLEGERAALRPYQGGESNGN